MLNSSNDQFIKPIRCAPAKVKHPSNHFSSLLTDSGLEISTHVYCFEYGIKCFKVALFALDEVPMNNTSTLNLLAKAFCHAYVGHHFPFRSSECNNFGNPSGRPGIDYLALCNSISILHGRWSSSSWVNSLTPILWYRDIQIWSLWYLYFETIEFSYPLLKQICIHDEAAKCQLLLYVPDFLYLRDSSERKTFFIHVSFSSFFGMNLDDLFCNIIPVAFFDSFNPGELFTSRIMVHERIDSHIPCQSKPMLLQAKSGLFFFSLNLILWLSSANAS